MFFSVVGKSQISLKKYFLSTKKMSLHVVTKITVIKSFVMILDIAVIIYVFIIKIMFYYWDKYIFSYNIIIVGKKIIITTTTIKYDC